MFKQSKRIILLALMTLLTISVVAFAQATKLADAKPTTAMKQKDASKSAKQNESMNKVAASDREFMMKAAGDGMAEVELGQLALKQASSEDVKKFAQRMVDDHTKANQELMDLAKTKGVTLPTATTDKDKKMMDKLAKQSGAEFDREYMKSMVSDHSKAVSMFDHEAKSGHDAETKAWADKTLPTLREHLQMARDTAKKVGVSATAAERQ